MTAVLIAERTTTCRATGCTPARLMIGREAVLPIKVEFITALVLDWGKVRDRAMLLEYRARALQEIGTIYAEARARQSRVCKQTMDYWNVVRDIDFELL